MSGSAINHEALEIHKKVTIMIHRWKDTNQGRMPRYLFLSEKAYFLLAHHIDETHFHYTEIKTFMGIEIAPVGVPGIYAGIGEDF